MGIRISPKKFFMEKRKYSAIDILRLTYKCAPVSAILLLLLTAIDAIAPTSLMALSTAYFVDTAMNVLDGNESYYNIFLPLAALLALMGAANVIGSLQLMIESRVKLSLDRCLLPAVLEVQAKLKYGYIEDEHSRELIEITSDEMNETFLDGLRAYAAVIRSVIGIGSIVMLVITQMWWVALLIAALCIPLFWVSIWAGKKNYYAKVKTRKYERRYSYFSDEVLCNREAVYERTLFGYADDVASRYYESFEMASRIQLKVLLKTRIITKLTSISLLAITMITALTLIEPVLAGVVSPGMFMGIVAALTGMAKTLGWQLQDATKNIAEAQEYMDDLTTLLELETVEGATALPD
ncbi:MAG: ABC transporter ATP-binding protein, partial [Acetatifactor sp.]|nr:ABC transporter ATP-binding protein [Acetatifactor sp.]